MPLDTDLTTTSNKFGCSHDAWNPPLSSTITIDATPGAVFGVLADPTTHQAIDGTGWVREAQDRGRLTETGQTFKMAMYHEGHPNKDYEIVNEVVVFDAPNAIAWKPGYEADETGRSSSADGSGVTTSFRSALRRRR